MDYFHWSSPVVVPSVIRPIPSNPVNRLYCWRVSDTLSDTSMGVSFGGSVFGLVSSGGSCVVVSSVSVGGSVGGCVGCVFGVSLNVFEAVSVLAAVIIPVFVS